MGMSNQTRAWCAAGFLLGRHRLKAFTVPLPNVVSHSHMRRGRKQAEHALKHVRVHCITCSSAFASLSGSDGVIPLVTRQKDCKRASWQLPLPDSAQQYAAPCLACSVSAMHVVAHMAQCVLREARTGLT
eukprot:354468-Chlamydomonas_euryale.AAC.3